MIHLDATELQAYWELVDILGAQRPLREILREAARPLLRLIPMDYGAACVTQVGASREYAWYPWGLPDEVFSGYRAVADRDWVRVAAAARPGVVLRDEEMMPRHEIEKSVVYRSCRARGLVMEQVMTVLLPFEREAHGGLTLYRSRRRAFSPRECEILRLIGSTVANVLKSHYLLEEAAVRDAALEALLGHSGVAAILIAPPAMELWRTDGVEALLARWFSSVERSRGGIPEPLLEMLQRTTRAPRETPKPWVRQGARLELRASLVEVPHRTRGLLLLILEEVGRMDSLPQDWIDQLTPRQLEVVVGVRRGWDNALIATELGCRVATVKKHLQRVFDKLGVSRRAALLTPPER